MINYYWTFKICARHAYTNISLYPAWGHVRVKINDEPTQSLGIKTGYPTRAVVWLVNIIAYNWAIKDECKVTWHDSK